MRQYIVTVKHIVQSTLEGYREGGKLYRLTWSMRSRDHEEERQKVEIEEKVIFK